MDVPCELVQTNQRVITASDDAAAVVNQPLVPEVQGYDEIQSCRNLIFKVEKRPPKYKVFEYLCVMMSRHYRVSS